MRHLSRTTLVLSAALGLVAAGLFVISSQGDSTRSTESPRLREGLVAADTDALPRAGVLAVPDSSARAGERPLAEHERALDSARLTSRAARVSLPTAADSGDLIVRVVDTTGAPVEHLWVWISSTPDDRFAFRDDSFHARSDADGRIVFEGVRKTLSANTHWYLVHDVAFEDLPRTPITTADLELPEVLTIQPDYGSVEVSVEDANGAPSEHVEGVSLQFVDPTEEEILSPGFEGQTFPSVQSEGAYSFPFVELERELRLRADRGSGFDAHLTVEGPRALRATVRASVRFGMGRPVIVLRAVDENGSVLANRALTLRMSTVFGNRERESVVTGPRGEFAAYFGLEAVSIFESWLRVSYAGEDGRSYVGKLKIFGGLDDGENHLGDIVLHPALEMVRGRVVDTQGTPLPGAYVRAGTSPDFGDPRSGSIETRSDENGAFTISGHEEWDSFKLWAFYGENPLIGTSPSIPEGLEGTRSGVLTVRTGDQGVELVLGNLVKPEVELILPEGAPTDRIELRLFPAGNPDASKSVTQVTSVSGSESSTHTFEALEPGNYTLRCALRGEDGALLELTGQWVKGPGLLARVDLRDHVFVHSIHLQGGNGEQLEGDFAFRESGSEKDWIQEEFKGDTVRIVTSHERVDVRVLPSSFRGELWLGLKGEATMTLRPPYRIRLVLRTDGEMPAPPYLLSVRPHFDGQDVGTILESKGFSGSRREMIFELPMAGPYSVRWRLEQYGDSFSIVGGVLQGHEIEIHVRDSAGEQVFVLPLDGEALAKLAQNPPWD